MKINKKDLDKLADKVAKRLQKLDFLVKKIKKFKKGTF